MRWEWAKVATDFHDNARVRASGRNGREVFLYLLLLNGKLDADGLLPHREVTPSAIACKVEISRQEVVEALARLAEIDIELIRVLENGNLELLSWGDEWRPRALTPTERTQRFRKRHGNGVKRNETVVKRNVPVRDLEGEREEEEEEEREEKNKSRSRELSPDAVAVAQYLYDAIRSHRPTYAADERRLTGWAVAIDTAIRRSNRSPDQLRAVIDYAHRDPQGAFWRANILGGAKLCEKFDQLDIQRLAKNKKPAGLSAADLAALADEYERRSQ